MEIKKVRELKKLTQKEAAEITGLSLRTFQNYEYGKSKRDLFKYNNIIRILTEYERISEDKGILKKEEIRDIVSEICNKHDIKYVYLFGSYARGEAKENSDIDFLIDGNIKGLQFVGLYDELCQKLHKKVDLLRIDDIKDNIDFISEILKTGEKIYG